MKFEITIHPLHKVLGCAGDAALDAASALREGASAVERRAAESLSQFRLEREIRDLQEEIGLQMRAVGEMMYASHRGGILPTAARCRKSWNMWTVCTRSWRPTGGSWRPCGDCWFVPPAARGTARGACTARTAGSRSAEGRAIFSAAAARRHGGVFFLKARGLRAPRGPPAAALALKAPPCGASRDPAPTFGPRQK